jgi:signal-transduction protein with cAMP-binding, CBS, and nucleotidyltransferase domain
VTPAEDRDKPAGPAKIAFKQPLPLLMQTFAGYHTRDNPHDFFYQVMPYFTHVSVAVGDVIWSQGDMADALYLIESGCLRATYTYEDHTEPLQETMVAGTVAGEMTALSGTHRNATAVAERDAQLWRLSIESLERLQREKPDVAKDFIKLVLKGKFRSAFAFAACKWISVLTLVLLNQQSQQRRPTCFQVISSLSCRKAEQSTSTYIHPSSHCICIVNRSLIIAYLHCVERFAQLGVDLVRSR